MPRNFIRANISKLTENRPKLILDADAAAGASSVTVKSITGVAANNILLFRELGNELAEIVGVNSATGNTVTLLASLVEAHPAGTTVYIIPWNQVRFYYAATEVDANASDSALTAFAAAQNIDPTTLDNTYIDTGQTSGFFYHRFSDSVNSINDVYSDPIPYGQLRIQFAEDEVGYLLAFVRRKLDDSKGRFSEEFASDEINAALRYM